MPLLLGQEEFRIAAVGKALPRPIHQHSLDVVEALLRPDAVHDMLLLIGIFCHLIDRIGRVRPGGARASRCRGRSSSGDRVKLPRSFDERFGVVRLRNVEIMAL